MYNSDSGKQLYRFYKEKEDIFFKNFQLITRKNGSDDFHDFRVSIKRIKAIFRLLELFLPEFKSSKYLKPFRSVYNPSGNIREVKVNLNTISQFELSASSLEMFKKHCKEEEKKSQEILKQKLCAFNHQSTIKTKKIIKRICKRITEEEILNKSDLFIRSRIEIIRGSIKGVTNEESAHKGRISLKEISAIVMLLRKMRFNGFNSELLNCLKIAEDKIGKWHDKLDLSIAIAKFVNSSELTHEQEQEFRVISTKISEDNKEFLHQIEGLMKNPINEVEKRFISI